MKLVYNKPYITARRVGFTLLSHAEQELSEFGGRALTIPGQPFPLVIFPASRHQYGRRNMIVQVMTYRWINSRWGKSCALPDCRWIEPDAEAWAGDAYWCTRLNKWVTEEDDSCSLYKPWFPDQLKPIQRDLF